MTDQTVAALTPAPATSSDNSKTSSSPLDVLDQILNDAQSKAAKDQETKQKEEELQIQENVARQKAEDQQKIQQQLADLQAVKQSPQYQAMVEQKNEVVDEKEEKAKELEGMEIVQLGHTTV